MQNKSFQTLLQKVKDFRDARDWKQFHDPKNLAEAISIESGELLELFLWKDKKNIHAELGDPKFKQEISIISSSHVRCYRN